MFDFETFQLYLPLITFLLWVCPEFCKSLQTIQVLNNAWKVMKHFFVSENTEITEIKGTQKRLAALT